MKTEAAAALLENRYAEDVSRQHVAGELHTREGQAERTRQRV